MIKGLIIIGHGSRSQDAVDAFFQVVELVRNQEDFFPVEGAFMELSNPGIPEVVRRVAGEGVKKIVFVPYFLYEGMHIKHDIPQIIAEVSAQCPEISFKMGRPIGVEPVLAQILIERAKAAE